jgi:hypothetical protein
MSKNSTSKRTVQAEERRERCLELRRAGASYRDIGEQLGISPSAAYKHVNVALNRLREDVNEQAGDLRTLELMRLDSLFEKAYGAAMAGDLAATDRCLRCMERRSKLLGLDAALRAEISGSLLTSPQWLELRAVLVRTLSAYPEARAAVMEAIAEPARELEAVTE